MSEGSYQSIWTSRYCRGSPLVKLFSEQNKIETWRRLWCWLAEAEAEAGLANVTPEALSAMKAAVTNIDWDFQREEESRTRHDVMSHIAAFEKAAPQAKGVIHLGATSAFVQDNGDLLTLRDALDHLIPCLVEVLRSLAAFAEKEASRPTVGLTHYQPATLTTVGKRATLWLQVGQGEREGEKEASRPTVGLTHYQPATLTTVGKRATLWLQVGQGEREGEKEASRPTVGLTHYQPATLTTVGKRATLWLQVGQGEREGEKEASRPTVGLTHYQPATLTTVGKRATLWLQVGQGEREGEKEASRPTVGLTHYQPATLTTVGKRATLWLQVGQGEREGEKEASRPTVGLTHYQPATLTTVGKRATLWLQELLMATREIVAFRRGMRLRGIQGATGTRASFLALFDGDREKVKSLNARIVELANVGKAVPVGSFGVTGQTYPRLEDARLLNAFALFAAATEKMCLDVRVLQSRGEVMESFGAAQVGSSAMPYKRNPMKCERLCGLARALRNFAPNALATAAVQGMERTLDDSANRRVVLGEACLCLEAVANTLRTVAQGLQVLEGKVGRNVAEELPFLALEPVLIGLVNKGADRQEAHHRIKAKALAAHELREQGTPQTLQEMLAGDEYFDSVRELIGELSDPAKLIGDAPNQVSEFLAEEVGPFLAEFAHLKVHNVDINV